MNILFVVKEFPHSHVIGGPIIIYNRVKYLSEKHLVSMIAFGVREYTPDELDSVGRYCEEMRVLPPAPLRTATRRARDFLFSSIPPYFLLNYSDEMYAGIADMVSAVKYDVVISEYSMVAQYLYRNPDLDGIKRMMSVHECYYLARRKALKVQGFSREGLSALMYLKGLKRFEFDMYADADRLLTLTHEGRDELLAVRPGLDISVVPHGVDVDSFRPGPRGDGPPTVTFLGNFQHDPNRDAAMYYGTAVWPLVRERVVGARLLVVGRGPTEDMLQMAEHDPSIEMTGEVEDVRPYLLKSDVFVCPVRIGGGFRGKVLEAMACGIPVVSTPLGAEGMPAEDGVNMLLAGEPSALADASIRLLTDRELARRLAESARRLVVEEYSWQHGVEILEGVLGEVVRGG